MPVRAQLGATINYQVGAVKRAPRALQKLGFEWLWRVWQEPQLWSRYRDDGIVFLRLLVTHVMPLALKARSLRRKRGALRSISSSNSVQTRDAIILHLRGFAIARNTEQAAAAFRQALSLNRTIEIDLSATDELDARFLGLILMLRKRLKTLGGAGLKFSGVSAKMEKIFRRNGLEYLLRESRDLAGPVQARKRGPLSPQAQSTNAPALNLSSFRPRNPAFRSLKAGRLWPKWPTGITIPSDFIDFRFDGAAMPSLRA